MTVADIKRKWLILWPARSRRAGRRRDRSAGFTLIEVLVSLAIAMMFMTILIRAFGSNWAEANAVDDTIGSTILARALIAEARSQQFEPNGVRSGTTNGFGWQLSFLPLSDVGDGSGRPDHGAPLTTPTKVFDDAQAQSILYHVVVDVAAPSGRHEIVEALVAAASAPVPRQ